MKALAYRFIFFLLLQFATTTCLAHRINGAVSRLSTSTAKVTSVAHKLDTLSLAKSIGELEEQVTSIGFHPPWSSVRDLFKSGCGLALIAESMTVSAKVKRPIDNPTDLQQDASELLFDSLSNIRGLRLALMQRFQRNRGELRQYLVDFHSEKLDLNTPDIDALLGIERAAIEYALVDKTLYPGEEIYPQNFFDFASSTYNRIRKFYTEVHPGPGDVVYDLGAGYGRVVLYGALLYPEVEFVAVEVEKHRAASLEMLKSCHGIKNLKVINKSVLDINLSEGTIFWMFNPFPSIESRVVESLKAVATRHPIRIGVDGVWAFEKNVDSDSPWVKRLKGLHYESISLDN